MDRRYKWFAEIIMITLFVWVIAGIITTIAGHILYDPPQPQKKMQLAATHAKKPIKTKGAYEVITTRDLLKVAKARPASGERSLTGDAVRPLAGMGLALRGTITGPKEIARAVIEDGSEQKLYRIGESIKGATVVAIFRNKVIMDVNGQEQMLVVEETKSVASLASTGTRARERRPRFPGSQRMAAASGIPDAMKNMDQFIGSARVVPYYRGGQPYGFRVSDVVEGAKIYELGVRSGDIIKSVNGVPIRTPEDALNAYQELQSNSSVDLEIERQGSTTRVTVPLDKK
jgi:general secretion pathway protein C